MRGTLLERWTDKVLVGDGCWEWTGYRNPSGYGIIGLGPAAAGNDRAHRVAYRLFRGLIPDGAFVCHTCDNPGCTKPSHLFLGTNSENLQDAKRKGRLAYPRPWLDEFRPTARPDARGEKNAKAVLSNDQVAEMRVKYAAGGVTQKDLAAEYGVHQTTVSLLVRREHYRELG